MMNRWKAWLWVAAIFLAGALVGVIAGHRMTIHFIRQAAANPEWVRDRIEKRITGKLGMDEQQKAKLHEIIMDSHAQLQTLRGEAQPRFIKIVDDFDNRVAQILNDNQKEKYQELIAERKKRWSPE